MASLAKYLLPPSRLGEGEAKAAAAEPPEEQSRRASRRRNPMRPPATPARPAVNTLKILLPAGTHTDPPEARCYLYIVQPQGQALAMQSVYGLKSAVIGYIECVQLQLQMDASAPSEAPPGRRRVALPDLVNLRRWLALVNSSRGSDLTIDEGQYRQSLSVSSATSEPILDLSQGRCFAEVVESDVAELARDLGLKGCDGFAFMVRSWQPPLPSAPHGASAESPPANSTSIGGRGSIRGSLPSLRRTRSSTTSSTNGSGGGGGAGQVPEHWLENEFAALGDAVPSTPVRVRGAHDKRARSAIDESRGTSIRAFLRSSVTSVSSVTSSDQKDADGGDTNNGEAAQTPSDVEEGALVLELCPAHLLPPPRINARILSTKRTTDAASKVYTRYEVVVQQGTMEWTILRRYSEFVGLHQRLFGSGGEDGPVMSAHLDKHALPPLPQKQIVGSLKEGTVESRQKALDAWLVALLEQRQALENVHVLAFLGLMSTSRQQRGTIVDEGGEEAEGSADGRGGPTAALRPVMNITMVRDHVEWGDLILFRSLNALSGVQRAITTAEWDHVGIVVKSAYSNTLDLLESTAEGVTAYPLLSRLRAYAHGFTKYMVLRKLRGEKTQAMLEALTMFILKVDGKPYGFSLSNVFPKKEIQPRDPEEELDADKKKTFFCSELVAAAFKAARVVPPSYNCGYFWPGSFAVGGEVDAALVDGFSLGEEILIDCRVAEVGRAHSIRINTATLAPTEPGSTHIRRDTSVPGR